MIGISLAFLSKVFAEIGVSLGKYEILHKKESIYAMGFLNSLWASFVLIALVWTGYADFTFSMESLPTFLLRAVFEVIILFVSLEAVARANRSTYSFLRIITIPLLLVVDIFIGYKISLYQTLGMCLIVFALLFLFINHGLSRKGKMLTILSAIIAVITISLYKYNITNFNSVAAEQSIMRMFLLIVLVVVAWFRTGENLLGYLTKPVFIFQSAVSGVAATFGSYAYSYGSASVILTLERAFEVLLSMVSGKSLFKEKHIIIKALSLILVTLGLLMMVL